MAAASDSLTTLSWGVVIVTSFAVAIDASAIGARPGLRLGSFADRGPLGWLSLCLLLWIVGLPYYLVKRSEIAARARVVEEHGLWAILRAGDVVRVVVGNGAVGGKVLAVNDGHVQVAFADGTARWVPGPEVR